MNKTIKKLFDKRIETRTKLNTINTAIESLQTLCVHNWGYVGHGHNSNFYKCAECGAEKDE